MPPHTVATKRQQSALFMFDSGKYPVRPSWTFCRGHSFSMQYLPYPKSSSRLQIRVDRGPQRYDLHNFCSTCAVSVMILPRISAPCFVSLTLDQSQPTKQTPMLSAWHTGDHRLETMQAQFRHNCCTSARCNKATVHNKICVTVHCDQAVIVASQGYRRQIRYSGHTALKPSVDKYPCRRSTPA
jgi:hypothetical protein